jgi:Rab proteins geranylgeranyltransferase component A
LTTTGPLYCGYISYATRIPWRATKFPFAGYPRPSLIEDTTWTAKEHSISSSSAQGLRSLSLLREFYLLAQISHLKTLSALAKAGYRVAHIDQNPYYGSSEASLSVDEFIEWAKSAPDGVASVELSSSEDFIASSRQYSLSLSPSIIPSIGPLVDSLIGSGVSRYGSFQLVGRVYIHSPGGFKSVPGSKEDIFTSKEISMKDKTRLMRFLKFAADDFEGKKEIEGRGETPIGDFLKTVFGLNAEIVEAIVYALMYCFDSSGML